MAQALRQYNTPSQRARNKCNHPARLLRRTAVPRAKACGLDKTNEMRSINTETRATMFSLPEGCYDGTYMCRYSAILLPFLAGCVKREVPMASEGLCPLQSSRYPARTPHLLSVCLRTVTSVCPPLTRAPQLTTATCMTHIQHMASQTYTCTADNRVQGPHCPVARCNAMQWQQGLSNGLHSKHGTLHTMRRRHACLHSVEWFPGLVVPGCLPSKQDEQ